MKSIQNFINLSGHEGAFQKNFKVYDQEGKKIGFSEVKRVKQYGRSTFYCPELQINKNK